MMKGGGDQIKGWATTIVVALTKAINWIGAVLSKTTILRTSIMALSAALVAWGISWALASWPILLTVAALAVLLVALDDVIAYFRGKKSLMGVFFKELNDYVDMLARRIQWLNKTIAYLRELLKGSWLEKLMTGNVARETDARQQRRRTLAARRSMTPEERKAAEAEDMRKAREAFATDESLGVPMPSASVPSALSGIRLPTTNTLPVVNNKGGDTTVNLHTTGKIDENTVRAAEQAAKRLQDRQSRNTLHTTSTRR